MNLRNVSGVTQRIIVHAARKAPAALAERLEEEWLADFECRRGPLARVRLALGCCWASVIIGREFGASQLATSGAPAAYRAFLDGLAHALPSFSHRTVIFALLAGFQVTTLMLGFTHSRNDSAVATPPVRIPAIKTEVSLGDLTNRSTTSRLVRPPPSEPAVTSK